MATTIDPFHTTAVYLAASYPTQPGVGRRNLYARTK